MYYDMKEKMLTIAFVILILVLSIYTNYQLQKMNEDLVAELTIYKQIIEDNNYTKEIK